MKFEFVETENNKAVLSLIARRLHWAKKKHGNEMPLDGTYDLVDALEEALDLSIYLAAEIIHIKNRRWNVKRENNENNVSSIVREAMEDPTNPWSSACPTCNGE